MVTVVCGRGSTVQLGEPWPFLLAQEALACPQHTVILSWAEESGFKAPQGPVLEPKARQNQCNAHGLQR